MVGIFTKSSTLVDWPVYSVCILLHNHLSLFQEIFFNSFKGPETRLCTPKIGGSGSRPMWCAGPPILRNTLSLELYPICVSFLQPLKWRRGDNNTTLLQNCWVMFLECGFHSNKKPGWQNQLIKAKSHNAFLCYFTYCSREVSYTHTN